MSTLAPYHHSPLPSPHHIRLLELLRCSDRGDSLTGTMRIVNIVDDDDIDDEEIFPYVALSYRWSEDASEELILDGKGIIRISKDLDAALRRFRYASALRWIWVDAICINQQNNAEKSMQIPLMAHIFRGASRVMIWLGNRAEDADLLRRTKSLVREAKAHSELFDSSLTSQATEARRIIASLSLSMSQLGRLAWFTRRWVLQELALNANAVLCCGQTELPWPQLAGVLDHSEEHDDLRIDQGRQHSLLKLEEDAGLRSLQLLWDLWWNTTISPRPALGRYYFELEPRDISTLMNGYCDFECSDGRDQIAALLGLSRDAQGPTGFRVDYADSVEQTYVKFAETLVRTGHLAWLLYQRFQREKERDIPATILPSWVPDWRVRMVAPPLRTRTKYIKTPASSIQPSKNNHRVHLLTTDFWRAPFLQRPLRESEKAWARIAWPALGSPPFLEILWKSPSFPKETGLEERVISVLVDLWPRIVARLTEDAKTSRRQMWCGVLLQVVQTFCRGLNAPLEIPVSDDDYPTFGEENFSDLEALKRYIRSLVWNNSGSLMEAAHAYQGQQKLGSELFAECLIFCQQPSHCLKTGSVCGMACVPASFYNQVVVGDKVLLANLGRFQRSASYDYEDEFQWSTYIVREEFVASEGFVGSAADGVEDTEQSSAHETNSWYSRRSKLKIVSPWVHEFVAPCQSFNSFPWTSDALASVTLEHDWPDDDDFGMGLKRWKHWENRGELSVEAFGLWIR